MPGETKAGPFTGPVRLLQSPSWVLTSKNAMTPREGPTMDLDHKVRGHESTLQTEATGKERGQLDGGTLIIHTVPTQS